MFFCCLGGAAEHACDFVDASGGVGSLQESPCACAVTFLANNELGLRRGRDLGKVGDAKDLMICRKLLHFEAHLGADLSADIGVDLIED